LEEAQEELRKWLSTLNGWNFEPGPKNSKIATLGDCMTEVESAALSENISAAHKQFIVSRFKFIRVTWPELSSRQPDEVSSAEIVLWMDRIRRDGYSAATIRGTLLYLRQTFLKAEDNKILFENPMDAIKSPSVQPRGGDRRKLSVADVDMVLAEMRRLGGASKRAADLAELLSTTGARLSEISGKASAGLPGLRWKDVNWKLEQLTLFTAKGRVTREVATPRIIPFHPRLVAVLERLKQKPHKPDDFVTTSKTARLSLVGVCKRLREKDKSFKIDRLSHHDLRHMFATHACEAGIDIPTVADLLGHRDGGALLLKTYRHLRTEHLHNAMKKLNPLPSTKADPTQ
jgi:site-specific recombinase XerD